tara:strand:+ start:27558 stop:28703 length:1146 start_codon:yes stop_codon:yes gene_type:complete
LRQRRITKPVFVGDIKIGGDAPISVQSMTKTDTKNIPATVNQIKQLEKAGCEIVRCAIPDLDSAKAISEIKKQIKIPLVADIHFHHELALKSIENGIDCLRLNPGNIRDSSKVKLIVTEAKARQIPIRIGVNFGSLPPVGSIGSSKGISRHKDGVNKLPKSSNEAKGEYSAVDHMINTALWEIDILESLGFDSIKISLKSFDISTTVEAYKRMARLVPYPFHLGITESGTLKSGSIRSSIGLGILLYEGIGDTIRVSLSDDPSEEIFTGFEILKSLELRKNHPILVACPSCGRADVDVVSLANSVENMLKNIKTPVKVAVMGCEVNGPGEAKDADVGIAAGAGKAIIFRKGKKSKIVSETEMLSALISEIKSVEKEMQQIS